MPVYVLVGGGGGEGRKNTLTSKIYWITDGNKYFREISEGGKNTRGADTILNKMV